MSVLASLSSGFCLSGKLYRYGGIVGLFWLALSTGVDATAQSPDTTYRWRARGIELALRDSKTRDNTVSLLIDHPSLLKTLARRERRSIQEFTLANPTDTCVATSILTLLAVVDKSLMDSSMEFIQSNRKLGVLLCALKSASGSEVRDRALTDKVMALVSTLRLSSNAFLVDEDLFRAYTSRGETRDSVINELVSIIKRGDAFSLVYRMLADSIVSDPRIVEEIQKVAQRGVDEYLLGALGVLSDKDDRVSNAIMRKALTSRDTYVVCAALRALLSWGKCDGQIASALRGKYVLPRLVEVERSRNNCHFEYFRQVATRSAARQYSDWTLSDELAALGNAPDRTKDANAFFKQILDGNTQELNKSFAARELLRNTPCCDTSLIKLALYPAYLDYNTVPISLEAEVFKVLKESEYPGLRRELLRQLDMRISTKQWRSGDLYGSVSFFERGLDMSRVLGISNINRDDDNTRMFVYMMSGGNFSAFMAFSSEQDFDATLDTMKLPYASHAIRDLPETLPIVETLFNIKANYHTSIARLVNAKADLWEANDWDIIRKLPALMGNSSARASIEGRITDHDTGATFQQVGLWIAIHAAFWFSLVLLYPRYRWVQSVFFWNKWVRRLVGAFYIELLLINVPYLRRILLSPFRAGFIKDADLYKFNEESYFKDFRLLDPATGEYLDLTAVETRIDGQLILEGASGLGKTMLLRHLLAQSKGIGVFLPAEKCADGIVAAIRKNVFGFAEDDAFLTKLVYSGALDIYIDGLNEVSADTRAQVKDFCERYLTCRVIISTQPMEWKKPVAAKVLRICPLEKNKILSFLLTQKENLPTDALITPEEFEQRCTDYLNTELPAMVSATREASVLKILSNPMDLTFVVTMLALGKKPNLFMLQRQQYDIMAEDFRFRNNNESFPLKKFSETVYRMRVTDEVDIPGDQYGDEMLAMEKFKMVYKRVLSENDRLVVHWYFRHDKIMEFFIVQSFLGQHNLLITEHLGDPRFSGVYFLLAYLLPIEEAESLERRLIDYSADNHDHTVSDHFIQILRGRKAS